MNNRRLIISISNEAIIASDIVLFIIGCPVVCLNM